MVSGTSKWDIPVRIVAQSGCQGSIIFFPQTGSGNVDGRFSIAPEEVTMAETFRRTFDIQFSDFRLLSSLGISSSVIRHLAFL